MAEAANEKEGPTDILKEKIEENEDVSGVTKQHQQKIRHLDGGHKKKSKEKKKESKKEQKHNTERKKIREEKKEDNRVKYHGCLKCPKRYRNLYSLKAHGKMAHSELLSDFIETYEEKVKQSNLRLKYIKVNKNLFECNICHKRLKIDDLRSHTDTHTDVYWYRCHICNRKFCAKEMKKYQNHIDMHSKSHCDLCKKKFTNWRKLHAHKNLHCRGDNYECIICKSKFNCEKLLKIHMENHHTGENFECLECHISFQCKATFKIHLKSHDNTGLT